jgi:hypothetical protein
MGMGSTYPSAYNEFTPRSNKYRFIALQLFASDDKTIINRVSYGLGELAAEIGGLSVSVSAAFMTLAGVFSHFRMTAIMSKRLY